MSITRKVSVYNVKTFFLKKTKILHTQLYYNGDGQEISKGILKKIRKDLNLDDENGIDTYAFFSKGPLMATDFIAYYRKTLKRLAKF